MTVETNPGGGLSAHSLAGAMKQSMQTLPPPFAAQTETEAALSMVSKGLRSLMEPHLYRLLRGSGADVEDVLQESVIKMWLNCEQCDEQRSPLNWAFTITHNTALDLLRRRRAQPAIPFSSLPPNIVGGLWSDPAPDADPAEVAIAREGLAAFTDGLAAIRPEQSEAVMLSVLEFSHPEIAAIQGVPLTTIKGRTRVGKAALRAQLADDKLAA